MTRAIENPELSDYYYVPREGDDWPRTRPVTPSPADELLALSDADLLRRQPGDEEKLRVIQAQLADTSFYGF